MDATDSIIVIMQLMVVIMQLSLIIIVVFDKYRKK